MSHLLRKDIPTILLSASGVILVFNFFFPYPFRDTTELILSKIAATVVVFSLYLGVVTNLMLHGRRLVRRLKEWYLSLWFMILFVGYIVLGFIPPIGQHPVFTWLYSHVQFQISQTSWTLLLFYAVSAAARMFRARNIDALAMLVAVVLVSFSIAPIYFAVNPLLPALGSWVLDVPNVGGARAIYITIGLGSIALAFRQMLGRERMVLGITEDE